MPALTNREFAITSKESSNGRVTWYTPTEYLKEKFVSVMKTEFENTSSSAGDWDGFLLQRNGHSVLVIPFWQENNWPSEGFTLQTGEILGSFPFRDWQKSFENFKQWYHQKS